LLGIHHFVYREFHIYGVFVCLKKEGVAILRDCVEHDLYGRL
jgi:hypothetical protein